MYKTPSGVVTCLLHMASSLKFSMRSVSTHHVGPVVILDAVMYINPANYHP